MSLNTEKRIIEAAIVVFSKNPFARLDEVARVAKVGRATLFRKFSTRKNLLNHLSLEVEKEFIQNLDTLDLKTSEPLKALKKLIGKLIPIAGKYQFLVYEPMRSQDERLEKAYHSVMKRFQDIIIYFQKIQLIPTTTPSYWAAIVCDHLIFHVWETIEKGEVTIEEATDLVFDALTNGIFKAYN